MRDPPRRPRTPPTQEKKMGRPIAKRFFGTGNTEGDIRCRFKSGNNEYDGYIIKQLGSKKFKVSNDANNVTAVCVLAAKNNTGLDSGDMTIRGRLDSGVQGYVSKISGRKCTLVNLEGQVLSTGPWNFASSASDNFIQLEESLGMAATAQRGNATVVSGSTDFAGNI